VLKRWLDLSETETALKRAVKEQEAALDKLAYEKYPTLTEAEIKTLVVDDKWMARLAAAVQGELERVSQTLTGRIRELAERYATPLAAAHRRSGANASPRGWRNTSRRWGRRGAVRPWGARYKSETWRWEQPRSERKTQNRVVALFTDTWPGPTASATATSATGASARTTAPIETRIAAREPEGRAATPMRTSPPPCRSWRPPPTPPASRSIRPTCAPTNCCATACRCRSPPGSRTRRCT
jgi:hypothetical protein